VFLASLLGSPTLEIRLPQFCIFHGLRLLPVTIFAPKEIWLVATGGTIKWMLNLISTLHQQKFDILFSLEIAQHI